MEANSGKHFYITLGQGQSRTWGYFSKQSNWCCLLTSQFTIPSPLHQRPPRRLPHPGSRHPHPNSLFLLSLLWLVLEAHHWDRNRKHIIKHQPERTGLLYTAVTYFPVTNIPTSHVLNTLTWGAKIMPSPCPQGAYTLIDTKLTNGTNYHPFLFFLFSCTEVFMWRWWYREGSFYISLSLNRETATWEGEIENRHCRTKARAGRPRFKEPGLQKAPWWPIQEPQIINVA